MYLFLVGKKEVASYSGHTEKYSRLHLNMGFWGAIKCNAKIKLRLDLVTPNICLVTKLENIFHNIITLGEEPLSKKKYLLLIILL